MEGATETAKALPRFQPGRERHAAEFGYKTPVEYLKGARDLVGRSGVQTFTRTNGDKLIYDATRNEFGHQARRRAADLLQAERRSRLPAGADREVSARLELAPEQRDELARLLGGDSLGALLQDWSRFVTEVERGYDDSIYESTNDISVRARLERVVAGASPGLRAQLERALADDDRRFAAATEEAARPLGKSPWAHRVPTRRTGELADDLAALGYRA